MKHKVIILVLLFLASMLTITFNLQTALANGYTDVTVSEAKTMID